jgi:voltage-gated potassium channel Kch
MIGRPGHPVMVILLLVCVALVAFSTAYLGLARAGEMKGLYTKVDSLYFTVITQTTVGYGDIVPVGQTARIVTMIQLLYGLAFLTTGGTALTRSLRDQFQRRTIEREKRGKI